MKGLQDDRLVRILVSEAELTAKAMYVFGKQVGALTQPDLTDPVGVKGRNLGRRSTFSEACGPYCIDGYCCDRGGEVNDVRDTEWA